MSVPLNIALAQINPIVGNLTYNADKILDYWARADESADLVVFPELAICGYPPEDLVLKPSFISQCAAAIQTLVEKSKGLKSAALIGAPVTINGKSYNAVHLIEHGEIKATTLKHRLPNYGVFDEQRIFTAGPLPAPMEFRGTKLGVMICEDMWSPDVAAHLKDAGAEILIVPNASPFDEHKADIRMGSAKKRTQETGLPLAYINQIGGQDELVFDGGSFILDSDSVPIFKGAHFKEALYDSNSQSVPDDSHEEAIYKALTLGLKDYIEKNNFPGVLIGLSGGIDSALSAVIAADAIGADKVTCVMMPSQFTSQDSLDDADQLAQNLGIKLDSISIEQPVAAFNEIISHYAFPAKAGVSSDGDRSLPAQGAHDGVAFENIQSRTRGLILMALSNASGKMVLSTGNKSEMAVGYATLYGDMCGGFNALKDVYKTEVYALSRWLNRNGEVIPQRIITKAPTAELKDNQTDQDTLPDYAVLDDILHDLIEEDLSLEDIAARGHDRKTVARISGMLKRAEYKRRQAPPGVKITPRAFGRDRRYPMTNGFKG